MPGIYNYVPDIIKCISHIWPKNCHLKQAIEEKMEGETLWEEEEEDVST
jgi:hypothetical protein